ncbi:MAG TPA: DUF6600 domain-containing protein [Myxococcales bacterium]
MEALLVSLEAYMRALVCALVLAVPSAALAQYDEPAEGEGTYSTYPADEARVEQPAGYAEVEVAGEQPRYVSDEQRLFDTFWYELSKYGRWEEDPTYSWVWYPNAADYRPYSDGWWVYTTEGWTYETDSPYGWAVYHYGRWAYISGGWAWLPGYEWSPGWVTMRVSGDYIGWSPIGPAGYVWDYWPTGWGYGYSPWLFVRIGDFGHRRHHQHDYCDHRRGESAFHEAEPIPAGHGSGRGGVPSWREIPNTHHAEPIPVVEGTKPADPSASSTGTVVIYRPRPTVHGPTVGAPSGGGGGRAYVPNRAERPAPPAGQRPPTVGRDPWPGSRPGPAVAPPRPSAPPAPAGSRFQPPNSIQAPPNSPVVGRPPAGNPGYRPETRAVPPPSFSRPPPPAQPSVRPVPPAPQNRPQVAPVPVPQPPPQPAKPSGPQRGRNSKD